MTIDKHFQRLRRVQQGSTQPQITTSYAYDDANNRTAKTVTGGSRAGTTAYTYNAFNQVTSYTNAPESNSSAARSATFTYDLNGNAR